jgi:hypothetical protein
MALWRFLDYVTDDSRVPIEEWVSNHLEPAERAAFDVVVDYLGRIDDWDEVRKSSRKYCELKRQLVGLTELKFATVTQAMGKNHKKQFRPLGILKRLERQFIFLGGFQKSNPGPIPINAYTDALSYKKEYEQNRGDLREHKT